MQSTPRQGLFVLLLMLLTNAACQHTGGRDLYAVLGVARTASLDALTSAHRALSKRTHPDKCGTAACRQTFLELQEAYTILSDPVKRQVYDGAGMAGLSLLEERRRKDEWFSAPDRAAGEAHEQQQQEEEKPREPAFGREEWQLRLAGLRATLTATAGEAASAVRADPSPLATLALAMAAYRLLLNGKSRRKSPEPQPGDTVESPAKSPSHRASLPVLPMPSNVRLLNAAAVASSLPAGGVYILVLLIPARPPAPIDVQVTPQQRRAWRRYGAAVAAARTVLASVATSFVSEPRMAFFVLDSNLQTKWRAFAAMEATSSNGLPLIAWRPGSSRRRYCRVMGGVSARTHGDDVVSIATQRLELLLSGGVPGDKWLEGTWLDMDV